MMTRGGFFWCALAIVAAIVAFTIKYQVRELEEQLVATERAMDESREAIHVLKAEWSYLNRPERLAELAARYLDLQPMDPAQMTALADVPLRQEPVAEPGIDALDGGETGTLVTFKVEAQ